MQKYFSELTDKLLLSVDQDYNVTNMGAVVEVIMALEKTTITKEALESTRLGKHINELRRKTRNDALAKRAKDLVRRWRGMLLPPSQNTPQPSVADTAPVAFNGTNTQNLGLRNLKPQSPALRGLKPQSPALRGLKPQSPALRGLKPQSPHLKATSLSRISSPSLSLHSDQSRSPVVFPNKAPVTAASNHRFNSNSAALEVKSGSQNHLQEAVPRTHSSNKRLRKSEQVVVNLEVEPANKNKKQRLNGETVSGNNVNSQVPSPTLKERNPELVEPSSNHEIPVVKKRGRKKGSKSIKRQASVDDNVKEKLARFSRNPKLKTTQELLADLQARESNTSNSNANRLPSHRVNHLNAEGVTDKNSEHGKKIRMKTEKEGEHHKHLSKSQNNSIHKKSAADDDRHQAVKPAEGQLRESSGKPAESDTVDDDTQDSELTSDAKVKSKAKSSKDLTAEELLAKLPPLNRKAIDWSDDTYVLNDGDEADGDEAEGDESKSKKKWRKVNDEEVDRLHYECVERLNGNFQPKLYAAPGKSDFPETCDDQVKIETDNLFGLRKPLDSHKDEEFREWHQMLARPSCDGEILHILPYVIID